MNRFLRIAVLASLVFGLVSAAYLSAVGFIQVATPAVQESGDIGWRLTKYGWQDSSNWHVDPFQVGPWFELVHPLVWAACVLSLVVIATIWASEEWEIDRLFERSKSKASDA